MAGNQGLSDLSRIQRELDKLQQAWKKTPQSQGGVLALRGFHYQLLTVLQQLVRDWLAKPPLERAQPFTGMSLEALSDWTTLAGSAIIACQVKHSLRTVTGPLSEFWAIHQLARVEAPWLCERLQYRMLSREQHLKDVEKAISNWAPGGSRDEDAKDLKAFLAKVSARIEPDPESELLALLANSLNCESPLETLFRWIGRLLSAAQSESGFDSPLKEIWNDLWGLHQRERSQPYWGYLWTEGDEPPSAVHRGDVRAGHRPTVRHLREGFFANREHTYNELVARIEEWMTAVNPRTTSKVQAFWIGGRSGTGKTVALLHVLSTLHQRGDGVVIWLGDNVTLLPRAVRWCLPLLREGRTVIIGVDDPYNPLNQAGMNSVIAEMNMELMQLAQSAEWSSMPLIVCCGPTEHRNRFKKDHVSIFDTSWADLPRETPDELRVLWQWFCERTGVNRPFQDDYNADLLLVQLVFEWDTGQSIAEFAHRFRTRIRCMSKDGSRTLEDFVSRMLALNRLYVSYPARALESLSRDPEFESALRRLRDEEHHLTLERSGNISGLRLAHPHLANALYNAWFDWKEEEPQRKHHLRTALLETVTYGEDFRECTAGLWAIARLGPSAPVTDLQERVADGTLASLIPEIYKELLVQFDGALPSWMTPVWVEIQVRFPALVLSPSPAVFALALLRTKNTAAPGLRLLCHKILQHLQNFDKDLQDQFTEAISRLLAASLDWYEWPHIVIDCLSITGNFTLGPAIRRWIYSYHFHSLAPLVLQTALKQSPTEDTIEAARFWLKQTNINSGAWSFVWEDLSNVRPNDSWVNRQGIKWLDQVDRNNPSWGHVWQRLHRSQPKNPQIFQQGRYWLSQVRPENGSWTFVWQDLRAALPKSLDLYQCGLKWLDQVDLNNKSWSYVWENLQESAPRDPELLTRGRRWLEQSDRTHPSWPILWEILWTLEPRRKYLVDLGAAWLNATGPDVSWDHMFDTLSATSTSPELVEEACSCLQGMPFNSSEWPRRWHRLYELRSPTAQLSDLGLQWLRESDRDGSMWGVIWQSVRNLRPSDIEVEEMGRQWLEADRSKDNAWGQVWHELYIRLPKDEGLIDRGVQWLNLAESGNKSWGLVWRAVSRVRNIEGLEKRARIWLDEVEARNAFWGLVWIELYRRDPADPYLVKRGLEWLGESDPRNAHWARVWLALMERHPGNAELLQMGRRYLEKAEKRTAYWGLVWGAVFDCNRHDAALEQLARQWLNEANPKQGYWGIAWESFRRMGIADPELLRSAHRCLKLADPAADYWGFAWIAALLTWPLDPVLLDLGWAWLSRAGALHLSWPHVWAALKSDHIDKEDLYKRVSRLLEQTGLDTPAWAQIWIAAWPILSSNEDLRMLALRHLENHSTFPGWADVWVQIHKSKKFDQAFLQMGRSWLERTAFGGSPWRHMWERLYSSYRQEDGLFALAYSWLTQTLPKDEEWRRLWSSIFDARPNAPEVFALGFQWLQETPPERMGWTHVLCKLLRVQRDNQVLFDLGVRWIESNHPLRDGWNPLWCTLIELKPQDQSLRRLAVDHLLHLGSMPKYPPEIWDLMFKMMPEEPRLYDEVCKWVKRFPKVASAPRVMADLCKANPANEEIINLSWSWLMSNLGRTNWTYLWFAFSGLFPGDKRLLTGGLAYLRKTFESPHWSPMWIRLHQQFPGEEEIAALGQTWLPHVDFRAAIGWLNVWRELQARHPEDQALRDLGVQWLQEIGFGADSWAAVWQTLYEREPEDQKLKLLGRQWLRDVLPTTPDWAAVWKSAYEKNPDPELENLAHAWLDKTGVKQPNASLVLLCLLQSYPQHPEYTRFGLQWLSGILPRQRFWIRVWQTLRKNHLFNEDLNSLGIRLLGDSMTVGWETIWWSLFSEGSENTALIELAINWLSQADLSQASWLPVWLKVRQFQPLRPAFDELSQGGSENRSDGFPLKDFFPKALAQAM